MIEAVLAGAAPGSLRQMMVEADYPRDPPRAIFVLPDMDELRFADNAVILFPQVEEAVHANLNRAVSL